MKHALAAMTCGAALVASMAACGGQDNQSTLPTSAGNTPDGATHASANSGTLYVPNYGDRTVSVIRPDGSLGKTLTVGTDPNIATVAP